MATNDATSIRGRRGRERRVWRVGFAVSLLAHVALFLLWRGGVTPDPALSAVGPERGDPRAAAGAMQALNLREAESVPVIPPPVPIAVEATVEIVEFDDAPRIDPAELLGDAPGLAEAPGVEIGTGGGNRGATDTGLDELMPPSPRGMIIPRTTNENLRGTEIQVWVFVDAAGRVVADSTRLEPPTRNRDFNRRLVEEASEWVFRPATRAGAPVAAWFPYRIIM
ncbi:MAG: hypothetical protein WD995_04460 [Gemmatimonadota bacterium]